MSIGNGNSDHSELQDLVYDEDEPLYVNECSSLTEKHKKECDGNCERVGLTEWQIELVNEQRAWQRAGMSLSGIGVDVLDMQVKVNVLMSMIQGEPEELAELLGRARLDFFKTIRLENEEEAKRAQLEAKFILPGKKPLLGPDGRPIGA